MEICRPQHLLGKWTSITTPTFIHLLPPTTGSKTGTFTIPTRGETSGQRVLFYNSQGGGFGGLNPHPRSQDLTTESEYDFCDQSSGPENHFGWRKIALTPFTVTGVVGIIRAIAAPSPQTVEWIELHFSILVGWAC